MLISCVLRQVQAQERVKEWWEPEEEEEEEEEVDEVEYDDGWGVKARMEALALLARIVSPSYCGSPHLEFPNMLQSLSFVFMFMSVRVRVSVCLSFFGWVLYRPNFASSGISSRAHNPHLSTFHAQCCAHYRTMNVEPDVFAFKNQCKEAASWTLLKFDHFTEFGDNFRRNVAEFRDKERHTFDG